MSAFQQMLCFKPQNINPKNSSKIYFACHPDEFDQYFDEVFKDVFETAQNADITCTVWYRNPETPLTDTDTDAFLSQLAEMQLVVVPVTKLLLDEPKTVMEKEIAFAKSKNIPILPLLADMSFIETYSRPEFFGDRQFLSKNLPDATALPFDKKLSDFLKSVLVGDEMRQKIQAAFDAYIFLSYRKKDRAAAQELMRLIHKNDFCRDIAIWYDEFLTPGENFNQAIKEALEKSELFTLVVTPNITEPHNYVLEHEYPMAIKAQKLILPVESIPTDRAELQQSFKNLPAVTNAHNSAELSEALLGNLKRISRRENDTPYHNYLIGLAYLNGIDVETDAQKAEELLTLAAKADLPEAMMTLSDIYKTGKGVSKDYKKSLKWLEQANAIYIQKNMAEDGKYVNEVIDTLSLLVVYYLNVGENRSAEKFAYEVTMYCRNAFKDTGNEQFVSTAVLNYLMLIQARLNLHIKQNPRISTDEVHNFNYSLYEKAAEFIEEFGLSPEQLKNIGDVAGIVYNYLSIYAVVSSNPEKAQEYHAKANELVNTSHELHTLSDSLFEGLSDGSLGFDGYIKTVNQYLDMCDNELSSITDSQKHNYLSQTLAITSPIPGAVSSLTTAFDPESDPDEFGKIKDLLYRYVDFFKDVDVEALENDLLVDLASIYNTVSEFEQKYGDIEQAKSLNQKCLSLAKKSFEFYPTQRAYTYWLNAVNDTSLLDPECELDKETWLQFEQHWEKLYWDPREPLNGLGYLATVYNNLMVIAEREEDYENLRRYSSKAYHLAKKRFSHTNNIDDEIKVLDAHRLLLFNDFRCDKTISNMDISRIMNRCAALLNDYKKYGLDRNQYQKISAIYCHMAYLLGTLCALHEDLEEAVKYLNIFLEVVPNSNKDGEFNYDIEAAQSLLELISQYNGLPDE